MTALREIGEIGISDSREGGKDYLLRPSFEAMTRIGEPNEIVEIYADIHGREAQTLIAACEDAFGGFPEWMGPAMRRVSDRLLTSAMDVLQACSDEDLTPIVGEWDEVDGKLSYTPGIMPQSDIVIFAQHLLQHGVTGKAKTRKLQRHESSGGTNEFNAIEYINAARIHFSISLDEARRLTMTEFQELLSEKYPNQKGLTKEEYSAVADDFLAKQAARRAAAKK
ncbi:DUF6246 family protein [Enterobacter asburiae]|uniref:DUF6246 family protein n=1 Tax=Enterobacter asburiae TaxID=61645 RepID=UPI0018E94B1F|nr:DUF6246 family protein [Enterobacter asburiae]MBJ3794668.1 hypothetical protein [Enterobacter asburiae]